VESARPVWATPREYDRAAVTWVSETSRALSSAIHPVLGEMRRVQVGESPEPLPEPHALPAEASPLYRPMEQSHTWTLDIHDVVDFNTEAFLSDLYGMADNMGSQLVGSVFAHISELLEGTPNSISAEGRDVFDAMIDMLDTIEMNFDDDGNHRLTAMMHPETAAKLQGRVPTQEQQAKIDQIIDRKRGEWIASRRRRQLPGHAD
jgi:hypothetical protein